MLKLILFILVNNCEFSSQQCIHLKRCTYFESSYQGGIDPVSLGNELQRLFCGFDGYEVMVYTINDALKFCNAKETN